MHQSDMLYKNENWNEREWECQKSFRAPLLSTIDLLK